jgi:hypothetical protein
LEGSKTQIENNSLNCGIILKTFLDSNIPTNKDKVQKKKKKQEFFFYIVKPELKSHLCKKEKVAL